MANGEGGALRKLVAIFDVSFDKKKLDASNFALDGTIAKVEKLGQAIVSVFAIDRVRELTQAFVELGVSVGRSADNIGISADALQKWEFAAQQAEVQAGQITDVMQGLRDQMLAASTGAEDSLRTFGFLGVGLKQSNGQFKEASDVLQDVGTRLAGMRNEAFQAQIGQKLLGSSWRELLRLFKEGKEGLKGLEEAFEAVGGGLSEEFIVKARVASKQFNSLKFAFQGLGSEVVLSFLPSLIFVTEKLGQFVGLVVKASRESNIFKGVLLAIVTAGLGKVLQLVTVLMGRFLITIAPVIAGIGLLALAIDEVITFFEEGDTLIGRFLDTLGGPGFQKTVREVLKGIGRMFLEWTGLFKAQIEGSRAAREAHIKENIRLAEDLERVLDQLGKDWDDLLFLVLRRTRKSVDKSAKVWESIWDQLVSDLITGPIAKLLNAWASFLTESKQDLTDWGRGVVRQFEVIIRDLAAAISAPFITVFEFLDTEFDFIGDKFTGLAAAVKDFFGFADETEKKNQEKTINRLKKLVDLNQQAQTSTRQSVTNNNSSVSAALNQTVEVNVNVNGTNANPSQIGNQVASQVSSRLGPNNRALIGALTPATR